MRNDLGAALEDAAPEGVVPERAVPEDAVEETHGAGEEAGSLTGPRPADAWAQLSDSQRRLWWLERFHPGDPAHRLQLRMHLRWTGDSVESLPLRVRRAVQLLVVRHESLRARVPATDGQPRLESTPVEAADARLPVVDVRGVRVQDVPALAAQDLSIEDGLPWRACWLHTAAAEGILLWQVHRLAADEVSMAVLARELGLSLGAAAAGVPATAPSPVARWSDIVHWQRAHQQAGREALEVEYWRRQWMPEGAPPPALHLPVDRPPAARQGHSASEAGQRTHGLSERLTSRLDAYAAQIGVSWLTLITAGYAVQLGRVAARGHDGPAEVHGWDFILGSLRSGRLADDVVPCIGSLEPVVGPLQQSLALRLRILPTWSFENWLRTLDAQVAEAEAYARVPYARIVERLRPLGGEGAPTPLIRVRCDPPQLSPMLPACETGALRVLEARLLTTALDVDLCLQLGDAAPRRSWTLTYRRSLWDDTTAARWLGQLEVLLAAVVEEPQGQPRDLAHLPLLTASERQALLVEWQDTSQPAAYRDPAARLARQARRRPEAVALLAEAGTSRHSLGMHVSFRCLAQRVAARAADLQQRGVGTETRVGLCLPRGVQLVECLLAVLAAGGAYVPLDPNHPAARREGILRDAGAQLLLDVGSEPETRLPEPWRRLDVDRWAPAPASVADLERLAATGPPPESLAYVLYTSGSTGAPRGVMVRRGSLDNLATALETAVYEGAPAHVRVAINAPMVFDASVKQWLQVLAGRTLVPVPEAVRLDAEVFVDFLQRRHVDLLDCTPSHLGQLLEAGLLAVLGPVPDGPDKRRGEPRLRLLLGGEEVPAPMWRDLLRHSAIRAWNVYGPTECTVDTTVSRVGSVLTDSADFRECLDWARPDLGRSLVNVRVEVLDGWLQPQPVGVPGELCIGGAGLARGYAGRPRKTAERFLPDVRGGLGGRHGQRLYRSGDLARLRPDGRLDFLGRIDFQVKVRGYRIELGEIEAVLDAHPQVLEAVALLDERGELLACVLPQPGTSPAAGDLRRFARGRLPDYMLPANLRVLTELPLTANGKVDRAALARPGLAAAAAPEAAATLLETQVAELFARVLSLPVEQVGCHSSFFALGGDSFAAARLAAGLPRLAGLSVRLRTVFEAPTPAALARRIERAQRAWAAPREPLEELTADLVGDLLGRDTVGLLDDLESRAVTAQGIELVVALEQRLPEIFGLEMCGADIAACVTVADLAARLARAAHLEPARPPIAPLESAADLSRLSFAQEELWYRLPTQPAAARAVVAERTLAAVPGRAAARRAWCQLWCRHPLLRTQLHLDGTRTPRVHVPPPHRKGADPPLDPFVDLRGLLPRQAAELRCRLLGALEATWMQAQDAASAALGTRLYCCCWLIEAAGPRLLLAIHPLLADRRTPELLLDDLQRLYRRPGGERVSTSSSEWAPPADHRLLAAAQRRVLVGELLPAEQAYWERTADEDGVPWAPPLPCDKAAAAVSARVAGALRRDMPAAVARSLRRFALDHGATPWMVLAAALARVCARRTGEPDIALALPVSSRRAHTERLPGPLHNTLVVGLEVLEEDRFTDVLEQVWTATLEAFTCRDLPHGRLLAERAVERLRAGAPAAPLGLTLHRPPAPLPERVHAEVVFAATLDTDGLRLRVHWPTAGAPGCWSMATARAWLDAFAAELSGQLELVSPGQGRSVENTV